MDPEKRDRIVAYLADDKYPPDSTESEKRNLRKQSAWFIVKNGRVLYHLRDKGMATKDKAKSERIDDAQLVIVSDTEKANIMEAVHSGLGGGHFGMNRTIEKIAERYWWPHFAIDAKEFVKNCATCQRANPNNKPHTSTLHPIKVTSTLGYRWCIDLVGPLNETKAENRYIATATEYLTRFAVAKPIANKDASTIAEFIFNDIICMFGVPKILQHDQGREFCNKLNAFMCEKLGIKEAISTAYHPQTNGLTERFNQTLVTQLMKVTNEKGNDWDHHLSSILFAYRVSVQESTKKTPYEMMFGAKPRLPCDINTPANSDSDPIDNYDDAVAARMLAISDELAKTREEGLEHLAVAQQKQKRQYDAKHQGTFYDIGDEVLKYNRRRDTRQGGKTGIRYSGPFKVHSSCGKGVYMLLDPSTGVVLCQKVNSRDLKRYNSQPKESQDSIDASEERDKENSASESNRICVDGVTMNRVTKEWQQAKANQLKLKLTNNHLADISSNVDITGDGNCLFRAVSYIISRSEEYYRLLRAKACETILNFEGVFAPLFADRYQSAKDYLSSTKMTRNGTYGTDTEVFALATLLQTSIYVKGRYNATERAWHCHNPLVRIEDIPQSQHSIYLNNINDNHFQPM